MRILFVHQNFPGQYAHLAPALAAEAGNEVYVLAREGRAGLPGITVQPYSVAPPPQPVHPLAAELQTKVARGEAAARAAIQLDKRGFRPDVICGHVGWGETLFLKDIWPDARLLGYFEYYYRARGADFGYDPARTPTTEDMWRLRAKNTAILLGMIDCDWGVSPTRWQWSQLPSQLRGMTSVIHDGIDTDTIRPDANAEISLGRDKIVCRPGDEVVTFVNRNFEPYRGFNIFMQALPAILRRRPNARVVLVGGHDVSYGRRLPKGKTYRQIMLDQVGGQLDMNRVHFVGRVPHHVFQNVLQVSAAHVYLTYPFVLSWSMLEAMATGCLVIGSRTAPVTEVIEDGYNGMLVDFFEPDQLAEQVVRALENPERYVHIRQAARETVRERFDLKTRCLPAQIELVHAVAERRLDPKAVAEPA